MLNHLPVVVLVLLSMGLLADCFHTNPGNPNPGNPFPGTSGNCNAINLINRPLIAGTQYQIQPAFGRVAYRCAPPAVDTVSRWYWYCTTGQWIPSIPVCTPSAVVNGGWGAFIPGPCNPPVCPDTTPMQTNTRLCNTPAPGLGGAYCPGGPVAATQIIPCATVTVGTALCTTLVTTPQTCTGTPPWTVCTAADGAAPITSVQSMWLSTPTAGCGCGLFGHFGVYLAVDGGCTGTFHFCYA